jgi:hypothetical protein
MSTLRITTDVLEIACEAGGADIAVARTRTIPFEFEVEDEYPGKAPFGFGCGIEVPHLPVALHR